jgi:arylsulfatase A-like enzyme
MAPTRREFLEAGASVALAATVADAPAWAKARRPNFLVVIVDTLRADYVSAYGGYAFTPSIDDLARRGLRFMHCYPEAMPTVPARRSIMTGRRVWPFRDWQRRPGLLNTPGWAPISHPDDTFTSVLHRAGYWTAYVTDNPFLGFSREYAPFRRSFDRFERTGGQLGNSAPIGSVSRRALEQWTIPELRESQIEERIRRFLGAGGYWRDETTSWAARVFGRAAGLLEGASTRQPFALVVDTYEPHEPWTPPRAYINLYGSPGYAGPEPSMSRYMRVREWLSPKRAGPVLNRMRELYAAEVTMTDHWLGALIARLRELGLESDTVIVLISDHGYLLGDHGWTGKIASILHPPLIRVPLIVVDPRGAARPGTSDYLAQTHDVGPTVLSLAGVRRPDGMDGVDLSPLLSGRRPREARKFAYGGYANWHYARTQEWGYVAMNRGVGRRLYDLEKDPAERRNIAREHPKRIDELHRAIVRRAGRDLPVYR